MHTTAYLLHTTAYLLHILYFFDCISMQFTAHFTAHFAVDNLLNNKTLSLFTAQLHTKTETFSEIFFEKSMFFLRKNETKIWGIYIVSWSYLVRVLK